MSVSRDAFGVPTIRGTSIDDLAFEQGRVTAVDRGGQIELDRLHAEGRTAEVLGIEGAGWDVFARQSLLWETARECFGRADTATQRFCAAYVAGVEAGLGHHQRQPGTWAPWTPMGIFLVQHVLFGAFPTKLWRARVAAALGEDALDLIGGEGPALSGSNAWVAGGGRTASGSPLIAGDPHRVLESPGVYQQVRLVCPDVDVVGLATDYCVRFTALDAHAAGFRTRVIVDATRGVELSEGDVEKALDALRAAGVGVVTAGFGE